jgi:hypothetical protein
MLDGGATQIRSFSGALDYQVNSKIPELKLSSFSLTVGLIPITDSAPSRSYAYTWEPRPGGPEDATDTVLFGLSATVNGYGQCNDDCPAPLGTPTLSCISNNTGSNLWWFSPGWYWSGVDKGFTSVNNP